ncbi:MAG: carbohydrate-binding protein [Paludibacteraceae bacterium]|nr:carbohydrate-binding protein [Paludibacteraceae bacterium]
MKYSVKKLSIAFALSCIPMINSNAAETLKVDLTDSIRPVTHCASGSLYGMTENEPVDIKSLVAPLKPHMFCQPPEGKNYNQHPYGDGYIVAKRLSNANINAQVQITLPDLLPNWPYKWPGINSWLSSVEKQVKRRYSEGIDNIHSYVIWNEPDGTWNNNNGDINSTVWKPTYELLRKLDPNTRIVGPCMAYYNESRMRTFLKFCKENNCLPDLICWHQWGSGGFADAVSSVRKLQAELGLPERPYCINEYCAGSDAEKQKYEGCPGYSVPFIAKFERYNVESATISWWHVPHPGRLGSLLTDDGQKGGGWWLYKWYGDMEGYMAKVTPPNDRSEGVDGFASVDKKHNCASLVLGGKSVGNVDVVFQKMPDFLSGAVKVKIERATWKSINTPVNSTDLISETTMSVNGGSLTVPVKIESELYGYRIYITPVNVPQNPYKNIVATIPGTIEAENYDEAGQGFSYYDNDDENKGDGKFRENEGVDVVKSSEGYAIGYTEKGEWLEYTVNVEESREYEITALVSNGGEMDGFKLYIDNKAITKDFTIPKTSDDWSVYEEVTIGTAEIEKGEHILKLEIVGSYVNIDWLKFSALNSTLSKDIYSFEEIEGMEHARFYDMQGNQIKKEDLLVNEVYIAITPQKAEGVKFVKKN